VSLARGVITSKHTDELISLRQSAKFNKDYGLSDQIRDELDKRLSFIFDHPDGFQEVWHLPETYFRNYDPIIHGTKRKYVELRWRQDRQAEDRFNAWLYSQQESISQDNDIELG